MHPVKAMLFLALPPTVQATPRQAEEPAPVAFTDVAATVDLVFEHYLGDTGKFYFPQVTAAGAALLDYDDDGDLDAYLVQGNLLDDAKHEDAVFPPKVPLPPRNRLFRNELNTDAGGTSGSLRFTDVTERSGTGDTGYGQGVVTGDVDNDGFVDLLVTNLGPDVLFHNQGDGSFADVTDRAGVGDPRWTTSGSFFDYDLDGFLDLFVVAYADYSIKTDKTCYNRRGERDYCGPSSYPPAPARLYRNQGDLTFEDVSAAAGIDLAYGHGLGVVTADLDGNGQPDVYVANDGDANQVWLNDSGRFRDAGLLSGATVNHSGQPEAGMGVCAEDFDNDGDPDLFLTHLVGETNTFYENLGGGIFVDRTAKKRLGQPSRACTGFGTAWFDANHDGCLDLFVANGAVSILEGLKGDPYPYHQTNQLFLCDGEGRFVDVSTRAGSGLAPSEVSRGTAAGDVDNDGDIDLLVSNANGPARLLRNDLEAKNDWVVLRVLDSTTRRDALGARVALVLEGGQTLYRYVRTDGSYCSANSPRVHFAWPSGARIDAVRVELFGREAQVFSDVRERTISTLQLTVGQAGGSEDGREDR